MAFGQDHVGPSAIDGSRSESSLTQPGTGTGTVTGTGIGTALGIGQQDLLSRRIARLIASRTMPAEHYLRSPNNDIIERPASAADAHRRLSHKVSTSRPRHVEDTQSFRFRHLSLDVDDLDSRLSRAATSDGRLVDASVNKKTTTSARPRSTPGLKLNTRQFEDTDAPRLVDTTTMVANLAGGKLPTRNDRDVNSSAVDFSPRGIHIPSRTSSKTHKAHSHLVSPIRRRRDVSPPFGGSGGERAVTSSAESMASSESPPSSIEQIALHDKGPVEAHEKLQPLTEDDPGSFDLLAPGADLRSSKSYSLEERSELLFSKKHLQAIFNDPQQLHRFTAFLKSTRPKSIPLLIYYLDALKALRAINYANAVAEALDPLENHDFTEHAARPTINAVLQEKAAAAFDALVREDLPAFITHTYIKLVSQAILRRVTGTVPEGFEQSEGLAEVFCFTDVSRPDNPIIFCSEEFHRTTQYGVDYAIGRNCRFLQGPVTNRNSVRRIRTAVQTGQELSEVLLNYRRDGSPFLNMLMMAPLYDSAGNLRYFIGAQIDISGLVKECVDLEALRKIVAKKDGIAQDESETTKDEFQELAEMLNDAELDSVRKHGGRMHRDDDGDSDSESWRRHGRDKRPRMHLRDSGDDPSKTKSIPETIHGRLHGVYQHYLLLRPAPSLRILFTSPSLRIPGILQSQFLDRIGGSSRVRSGLAAALAEGQGVTAKIKWLTNPRVSDEEGRPRWIHATPLLDAIGRVGVWMVILVDETTEAYVPRGKFRPAPPVAELNIISRHEAQGNARPGTRNNPETDSIVMRTVPGSKDSSDGEAVFLDDEEFESAPGPHVRNVQRKQPRIVHSADPLPPFSPQSRTTYPNGMNGANGNGTKSRPGTSDRPGPTRAPPPPPLKTQVRINTPTISPPLTPHSPKTHRSFLKLGMNQVTSMVNRRGNDSADSVAL